MTTASPADDSSELDPIIASYLEAIECGEIVDRELFLQQHPDFANELRTFFVDFDRLQLTKMQPNRDPAVTFVPQHEPKPGAIFGGRFKLLENIGEGGMGSVWVAEQQQPVKRRVAIKLVKAGMDSKQVLARFEAERQALALMDHPNIAKVFDGGMTEHGRPYFVMEYVKGVPFTDYCDKVRLSLRERLELFIPVCQAVQHAHHKGIVHRDLKPSNILICLYDGKPVPKVIDFGLAKAMHQQLTEQSIYTAHGVMVGTPLYMSPEQAEHNNLDVDTRTDIYSLGVVLYELLTGTTPLEREQVRAAAYNEVLRLIKEVEAPRPSLRLSGSDSLPSIAAQRSIDPRHLQKSLVGDLDWIVMKSLEKERTRRYDTALSLQRDIDRFLNNEPVEACPPSRTYRLRKFANKHRAKVTAAVAVLLALIIGIIGTTWQSIRATKAERAATASEQQAVQSEQKAITALEQTTKERDAKNVALNEKTAALSAEAAARNLAERQMIEGMLRPIGFKGANEINAEELRCYVDWAAIPDSLLKLRVLEVAFENPETAFRIARRADRVAQACVGLSPQRRLKALELLAAKQRDTNADPRIRVAACWLAMELGSTDTPALTESLQWLNDPLGSGTNLRLEFRAFVDVMTESVDRLSAEQIVRGGNALIAVLEKSKDYSALEAAGTGLSALVPKLSPEQITSGGNALIAVIQKSNDNGLVQAAWNTLVTFMPKSSNEQITKCGNALIGVLEESNDDYVLKTVGTAIETFAPKLSDEQIIRGGNVLLVILEKSNDTYVLASVGHAFLAIAPKLSNEQITRGGNLIINIWDKTENNYPLRQAAGDMLAAFAPKLNDDQMARTWDILIAILENPTNRSALEQSGTFSYPRLETAAQGLVAIAPRLNPDQIKRSGNALMAILENSNHDSDLTTAGDALVAIASQLQTEQIRSCGDALIAVLDKSEEIWGIQLMGETTLLAVEQVDALQPAGTGLLTFVENLSDSQITRGWERMIAILEKSKYGDGLQAVGDALVAFVPRLNPEQIKQSGDALITIIEKSEEYNNLQPAVNLLIRLAPQLNAAQITRSEDALIAALVKAIEGDVLQAARNGLLTLAPKLSAEQINRCGDALIAVLQKQEHNDTLRTAGNALAELAPRLNAEQRVSAAEAMMVSLLRTNSEPITQQLMVFTPHLEPATQDRIATGSLLILFDFCALAEGYFLGRDAIDLELFRPAIMAMTNPRSIARLMQHPACIGEPRECMLQRFEELIFHNGQRVFLQLPESETNSVVRTVLRSGTAATPETAHGDLKPNRSPAEPLPRRFHTLHDAATWIQHNWPDFDLDATHHVTWRGEPK